MLDVTTQYSQILAARFTQREKAQVIQFAQTVGCDVSTLLRGAVALALEARAKTPNRRDNLLLEIARLLGLPKTATVGDTIDALQLIADEIEAENPPGADALNEVADPAPLKLSRCTRTHCAGDKCKQEKCTCGPSTTALRALSRHASFAPDPSERAAMAGLTEIQRDRYVALRLARKRDAIIAKGKAH